MYDTTDWIKVDPHHGLVKINSKARLCNVDTAFVFVEQCQQVYYTYASSFKKNLSRVDWLSVVKTKPRGRVEIVHDRNNELTTRDDVFQLGELVAPYQVSLSKDLEENLIFLITNNNFVDVDAEELNDILSSSGYIQVDEYDDRDEINVENCDGDEDELIDEEKDNSD